MSPHSICRFAYCGCVTEMGSHTVWPVCLASPLSTVFRARLHCSMHQGPCVDGQVCVSIHLWMDIWVFSEFWYCELSCYEHLYTNFCLDMFPVLSGTYQGAELLGHMETLCLNFSLFFQSSCTTFLRFLFVFCIFTNTCYCPFFLIIGILVGMKWLILIMFLLTKHIQNYIILTCN